MKCEPGDGEAGDTRCQDCEIAACRKANCCPTCAGRTSYACCGDEFSAPLAYPLTTPKRSREDAAKDESAVRAVLTPMKDLLESLCGQGLARACSDLSGLYSTNRFPFFDEARAGELKARARELRRIEAGAGAL